MGPSYKSVLVSIQFIESGDKCNLFSANSRIMLPILSGWKEGFNGQEKFLLN